jgi:vancomycin resistance protein YoaR
MNRARTLALSVAAIAGCSDPIKAHQAISTSSYVVTPKVSASVSPPAPLVLSSFSTTFNSSVDGRTKNISIASGKINGFVIEPKATMSFNQIVGIRSAKNGYVDAPVLLEGRRVDDLGGGVCQVSSTLHAAAVHGHLTIKERYPHTLVPKYIHAGYDATVAFPESCDTPDAPCGKIDLRIVNPYGVPVTIRTEIQDIGQGRSKLFVWLEGVSTDCQHTISYWDKPLDRGTQRQVRSSKILDAKYVKKVQEAAAGMVIWSSLVWKCPGKPDESVRWFSRYPSVDEVWEVGWKRPRDAKPPWETPDQEGATEPSAQ